MGFQMSKYQSAVSLQTNFLIWLKASWYVGFHTKRYITIPRKYWSCCLLSGGGILWIASTFLGSGWGSIGIILFQRMWLSPSWLHTSLCWRQDHVHRLYTWSCAGSCHGLHHLFHEWWHHLQYLWLLHSIPEFGPSSIERYPGHMIGPRGGAQICTFPMVC